MRNRDPALVLLIVSLATALSLLGDSTIYAVLPIRASELGIALGAVGILLSINRFVRILLNGPMGILADRWSRRSIFVPSVFLGALSTALMAVSPGFWPACAARLLWGVAWAGIWVSGNAIIMDAAPLGKRGRWIGLYHLSFFLGAAAGSMMGGILTDWIGFRPGLAFASVLTFVGAAAAALFLPAAMPATQRLVAEPGGDAEKVVQPKIGQRSSAAALLGINRLVMAGVLASTLGLWFSQQIGDSLGFGRATLGVATVTGLALGAGRLIAMVVSPTAGALSDRYRSRWGVVSGGLSCGVVGFGLLALGTPLFLALGVPLTSVSSGSNQGLSTALIGDLSKGTQFGRHLGVLYTIGDIGSAIGPLLAFALLPIVGLSWIYLGSAGLLGIVLLMGLRWAFRAQKEKPLLSAVP